MEILPQAKLIRRVQMTKEVLVFLVLPANNTVKASSKFAIEMKLCGKAIIAAGAAIQSQGFRNFMVGSLLA